jgi:hypothetical protein
MMDEEKLKQGFADYKKNQQKKNAPILRQLEITDDLISQRERELENKLANLDAISSRRAKIKLGKKIAQIEEAIDRLEIEKSELEARLRAKTLTPEQIASVLAFAAKIRAGLSKADEKFAARRVIIDTLDVKAMCAVEDGQKVVYVECYVGENVLDIAKPTKRGGSHNSQDGFVLDIATPINRGRLCHRSAARRPGPEPGRNEAARPHRSRWCGRANGPSKLSSHQAS